MMMLAGCKEGATQETTDGSDAADLSDQAEVTVEKDSNAGSSGGGYKELVQKISGMKYMVKYDITNTGQGKSDKMTMTQYFGGQEKVRMDTKADAGEARIYMIGKEFYSCSNPEGKWQCIKFTNTEEQQNNPSEQFNTIEQDYDKYDVNSAGTMNIAGTVAKCFEVKYGTDSYKHCFSKEGVPLYMRSVSQGYESEMKASEYRTSVSSSDFELPAEAVDMNAMMAKYGAQMPQE